MPDDTPISDAARAVLIGELSRALLDVLDERTNEIALASLGVAVAWVLSTIPAEHRTEEAEHWCDVLLRGLAERARVKAAIRADADAILANFDRERISPGVAIAICIFALDALFQRAPHYRAEFIACIQGDSDA